MVELTEGSCRGRFTCAAGAIAGSAFCHAGGLGWGGFDGSKAVGFSAAGVVANNLLRPGFGTVVLDGGVGIGTDEGEVVGRAGLLRLVSWAARRTFLGCRQPLRGPGIIGRCV